MSIELVLERFLEHNGATLGKLSTNTQKEVLWSLEDAWKNNANSISCIPAGKYKFVPHGWEPNSPVKFKKCWRLVGVPGREAILIHAGNTDADTQGCILAGIDLQITAGKPSILQSKAAMEHLRLLIGPNEGVIVIKDLTK